MEGQVLTREFQNNMKLADVPPIFKKETIKKKRQLRAREITITHAEGF